MAAPATNNSAVDIIPLSACLVRIQKPRSGQTPVQARVTQLQWNTSVKEVTDTISSYNGGGSGTDNVMLWLYGKSALGYAGLTAVEHAPPQPGLDADNNAVTIILPSGLKKLQQVQEDRSQLPGMNKTAGGNFCGIAGTLAPADLAWTTVKPIKDCVACQQWPAKQLLLPPSKRKPNPYEAKGTHFGAVRGDNVTVLIEMPNVA